MRRHCQLLLLLAPCYNHRVLLPINGFVQTESVTHICIENMILHLRGANWILIPKCISIERFVNTRCYLNWIQLTETTNCLIVLWLFIMNQFLNRFVSVLVLNSGNNQRSQGVFCWPSEWWALLAIISWLHCLLFVQYWFPYLIKHSLNCPTNKWQ